MAAVFYFPLLGTPTAPGNLLSFYESGTNVVLDVWTDSDLTIAWSQPIVLNLAGESDGPIYVSPTPDMNVVYTDANGVAIPGYPVDFVTPSTILNVMTTAIVPITNAQLKASVSTPITIVAAPGSGVRLKVLGVTYHLAASAGGYTNINTTYAWMGLLGGPSFGAGWPAVDGIANDSTVPTTPLADLTAFLGTGADYTYDVSVPQHAAISNPTGGVREWVVTSDQQVPTADLDNQPIVFAIDNNGSGNLTGGNAANTLTVVLYYAREVLP